MVTGYLVENAYGARAGYWGPESITGRLGANFDNLPRNFAILVSGAAISGHSGGGQPVALATHDRRAARLAGWNRNLAAVWVVVAVGYLALMSTSNMGFWFSTPLDILAIVGLVGLVGATQTAPVSVPLIRWTVFGLGASMTIGLMAGMGRQGWAVTAFVLVVAGHALWCDPNHWQRTMGASVVGIGLVTLAVSASPVGAGGKLGQMPHGRRCSSMTSTFCRAATSTRTSAWGRPTSPIANAPRPASQEASHQVAGELATLDAQGTYVETIVGSMHLFNANTIGIAAELYPRGRHDLRTVNTIEPSDEEIGESLTPMVGPDPRVFVIIEGRS